MRFSASNLAWGDIPLAEIAPRLKALGLDGVEIAPTALWAEAPHIDLRQVREVRAQLADHGLAVSGVQSLLFGHPELQLFDRSTWDGMLRHLSAMVEVAGALGAGVAVFGSPRNRVRGALEDRVANEIAASFLIELEPVLAEYSVVLTLEPNAPAYGADFVTTYAAAIDLAEQVGSQWVQPQVDTGCMYMVSEDIPGAVRTRHPAHVHVSVPNLTQPPGPVDHQAVATALRDVEYRNWVVLEMLRAEPEPVTALSEAAAWMRGVYGGES